MNFLPFFVRNVCVLLVALRVVDPFLVHIQSVLEGGLSCRATFGFLLTLFQGASQLLESGKLFGIDLLGGVKAIFVQPILGVFVEFSECILFVVCSIRSQLRLRGNLVTHVVNVGFQFVAHVSGFRDNSVRVGHGNFDFIMLVDFCLGPFKGTRCCVFQAGLGDFLLFGSFLAFLDFGFLVLFFRLGFINGLGRTEVNNTMNILLDIDAHLLFFGRSFDSKVYDIGLGQRLVETILLGS